MLVGVCAVWVCVDVSYVLTCSVCVCLCVGLCESVCVYWVFLSICGCGVWNFGARVCALKRS